MIKRQRRMSAPTSHTFVCAGCELEITLWRDAAYAVSWQPTHCLQCEAIAARINTLRVKR